MQTYSDALETAQKKSKKLAQNAMDASEEMGGVLAEKWEEAKGTVSDAIEASGKTVRENPFYFIAGAAAVGLISGYFLACARNKE